MKKLFLATTALCFVSSASFAGPAGAKIVKPTPKPSTRTSVKTGAKGKSTVTPTTSAAPTVVGGVSTSGSPSVTGAYTAEKLEATANEVLAKIGSLCSTNVANMTTDQKTILFAAMKAGIVGDTCFKALEADPEAEKVAAAMAVAGYKVFERTGKTDLSQLDSANRIRIVVAFAGSLVNSLGVKPEDALARLRATIMGQCDIVGKPLQADTMSEAATSAVSAL